MWRARPCSCSSTGCVGVTPDGTVAVSDDAGRSWTTRGSVDAQPQALGAHRDAADAPLRVFVVTDTALLHSDDAAATFTPYGRGLHG